ncbi:MAG: T9SS type A sorting domain-containing protein [Flavobacteriales bacterium]|nr:T9SS type A sorting domain-containing protein [Flavobacteriales bacterium]
MMQRLLSTLTACVAGLALSAQVTVYVQQPPGLEGPLEFTWAAWGQNPDLNDPANNLVGTACFVDDGTAADSLGCNALVNGADIAGKIAVVYRGVCEFGAKALNAEMAGAIAVVIINNAPGAPVGMGAGAQGANVTIPVVMISQESGATLHNSIATCGELELFIGSQTGYFQYNLGMYKNDILIPRYGEINSLIASNASEFSVQIGTMMHNYGALDMPNARVQCVVTQNGSNVVYDQTSAGVTLLSGDSLFVTLPDFSQSSYSGQYAIAYALLGDNSDEFTNNDAITVTLTTGDKITYAPADATTQLPAPDLHTLPGANTTGFRSCVFFSDPNASRLAMTGLWFSASAAVTDVLTDEVMTGTLYQWTDAITDQITLPTDAGLIALTSGEYIFDSDLRETPIFMPFLDVVTLQNNTNYLVCLDSYSGIVRHGWDNSLSYDRTQTNTLTPVGMLRDGTTWYNGFTGITGAPSIGMQVINANSIGIPEQAAVVVASPFPNPTADILRIPVKGYSGAASMRVFDSSGAQVINRRSSVSNDGTLVVNLCDLANGLYLFHMDFENGQRAEFRVQVMK